MIEPRFKYEHPIIEDGREFLTPRDLVTVANDLQAKVDRMEKASQWVETAKQLPVLDRSDHNWPHAWCLVDVPNYGILVRPFNVHHKCWDDEEADDHFKEPLKIPYWMPLPDGPKLAQCKDEQGGEG